MSFQVVISRLLVADITFEEQGTRGVYLPCVSLLFHPRRRDVLSTLSREAEGGSGG